MKLLLLLLPIATAFTVIPYIQIDFAHYFRLAQCQAKCTEKYGTPARRTLNDGTIEEFVENLSEEGKMCELGCQQHRRSHKKVTRSTRASLHDGARFWLESSADTAKIGTCPISEVDLLCQNPIVTEDLEETIEGLVGLRLARPVGAVKYVVQWKQRTYALGFYDESQWITASIESSTSFKVDGFLSNVQYRFMVTVVGPNGRLGDSVLSDWSEIMSTPTLRIPSGPLVAKNTYNSEYGASAQIHWSRSILDSCYFRLQYVNSTSQITMDFTADSSESVLLANLEFDSVYDVQLSALSRPSTDPQSTATKSIFTKFTSFECQKVYGKGSLNCPPEPVSDLRVQVRSNGSATISWTPSVSSDNVLTYQLSYQALRPGTECQTEPLNVYLNAASTNYDVFFPGSNCEYLVRLTNYDLLGRDAQLETRVEVHVIKLSSFIQIEYIIIAAAISLAVLLCLLLRCILIRKCPIGVSEKTDKLTESSYA